jgi:hypothetical protein
LALSTVGCGQTVRNSASNSTDVDTTTSTGGFGGDASATTVSTTVAAANSAGGAGGSSGADSSTTGALEPPPNEPDGTTLDGWWAMFTFEDPVVVRLSNTNGVIEGWGCCTPETDTGLDCCGFIEGEAIGLHTTFSFSFEFGATYTYAAHALLSEDGSRLGGYFKSTQSGHDPAPGRGMRVAWLRLGADPWLATNPEIYGANLPTTSFELAPESPEGDDFVVGESYTAVFTRESAMGGDFGSFWATEISIRPEDGAILAGPVPATDSSLPVSVVLNRDGDEIVDATVTMPLGQSYLFVAVEGE